MGVCVTVILLDPLGLEVLEGVDVLPLDKGIQSGLGSVVWVALACEPDADTPGRVTDTLGPHKLVQVVVDADVGCLGEVGGKLADGLDGCGCLLLELLLVHGLGEVDRGNPLALIGGLVCVVFLPRAHLWERVSSNPCWRKRNFV